MVLQDVQIAERLVKGSRDPMVKSIVGIVT